MTLSGCARCLVKSCKWLPVLFILAIICWSYYAYVAQLCFSAIDDNDAKRWSYFVLYHLVLAIFLWAYFKTIFTPVKSPPDQFYLAYDDIYHLNIACDQEEKKEILNKYVHDLPLATRTDNGGYRFCETCNCLKPDRCHHCSMCDKCVLKMDHHCPWVNNCVGHSNYKFFMLFLFYAIVYCIYIAATTLEYFIQFWTSLRSVKTENFQLLFLFFVSAMFMISVSTLFGYHLYLIARNRSTLESYKKTMFLDGVDANGFNLGLKENFKQVFGDRVLHALLPIFTSKTDGVTFPCKCTLNSLNEITVPSSHLINCDATSTIHTNTNGDTPTYNTINIKLSSTVNKQSSFVTIGNLY